MKRIISIILAFVMLAGCFCVSALAEEETLKLGDYITLGKYNGEDIMWRYVADDENGKMFLSDEVLCEKSYCKEDVYTYEENEWYYSSLRCWLNCDNASGIWKESYYKEEYIDWEEDGFLHKNNFTDTERLAIKSAKNRTTASKASLSRSYPVVNAPSKWSFNYGDHLSGEYFEYEFIGHTMDEYNALCAEHPVSTVFLLDVSEVLTIHKNFPEYIARETSWWLRTPEVRYVDDGHFLAVSELSPRATKIEKERGFEFFKGKKGEECGIRPAFYLNEKTAVILSGDGTKENPYRLDGKCEEGLQIGDYISVGKFEGEPILWRYVADDENGKLFLSERNLTKKPFAQDGYLWWNRSYVREYLREDFFDAKKFGEADKNVVKNVDLWHITFYQLGYVGSQYSNNYTDSTAVDDYFKLKGEYGEENIFLLNFSQLHNIYNNYEVLGDYLVKVDDSAEKVQGISSYTNEPYTIYAWWTRDLSDRVRGGQAGDTYGGDRIRSFLPTGNYGPYTTETGVGASIAVRPAFYLDEENAYILGGLGTKSAPYVVTGKKLEKFEENGLYGYKDNFGNVIVPAKFLKAGDFSDNAALVILPEDPYRVRYIDMNGNYLFDKAFYAANNFNNGYALIVANEKGEYAYIDKTGEIATDLRFEYAEDFSNGWARVILNGEEGTVGKDLMFHAGRFGDEYAVMKTPQGFLTKILNKNGDVIFEYNFVTDREVKKVKDNIYMISNPDRVEFKFVDAETGRVSDTYTYYNYYTNGYLVYHTYEKSLNFADLFDKEKVYFSLERSYGRDKYIPGDYIRDISIDDEYNITINYFNRRVMEDMTDVITKDMLTFYEE